MNVMRCSSSPMLAFRSKRSSTLAEKTRPRTHATPKLVKAFSTASVGDSRDWNDGPTLLSFVSVVCVFVCFSRLSLISIRIYSIGFVFVHLILYM